MTSSSVSSASLPLNYCPDEEGIKTVTESIVFLLWVFELLP